MANRYETETWFNEYMLFHYGTEKEQLPFAFGPKSSLHFPVRIVTECVDFSLLPKDARALDLGCAVGRSSFELSRYCQEVMGVDFSSLFIQAAQKMQAAKSYEYVLYEEGDREIQCTAHVPEGVFPERVTFKRADVMEFAGYSQPFDIVLAANLLCRLPDPEAFLKMLSELVKKGGQLILISPYSWLEEFTPKDKWLINHESIRKLLSSSFELKRCMEMPFLMREHSRKYQWSVSEASIWIRY